jgi:iron-sulfur cluster assembly accessory protein
MVDTLDLAPVALTEKAAKQVRKVLSKEPDGSLLRVAVNGGGCSGFQYAFDIVRAREPDDLVVERDGAVVLIDPVSLDYMRGSSIDYVDDLIGQAFKIENPNATASCGCGTSFAL